MRTAAARSGGWLAGLGWERGWTVPSAPVRSSVGGHCVCLIALLPHTRRQVGDDVRGNPPVSKSRYAQKKKQKPDQFKVCVLHVLLYVVHTATGKK